MRFGDKSERVKSLQNALSTVGYPCVADGEFGAATESQVKALQANRGLTIDGIVGPATLKVIDRMEAELAKKSPSQTQTAPTPSGLPVNAPGSYAKGMDISNWDKNSDWSAIVKAGIQFVFIKATEGTGFKSSQFSHDFVSARAMNILRGAYHFFHPNLDGRTQANFFLSTMGGLYPTDLPPVLDIEMVNGAFSCGASPQRALEQSLIWLAQVKLSTKKTPIIYSNRATLEALGYPEAFKDYSLWFADPGVSLGTVKVPRPWTSLSFLQTSFTGNVPGVHGAADLDIFNGTYAQLKTFAMATA